MEKKYLLGKERLARAHLLPLSSALRAHSPEKRPLTPSSCGPGTDSSLCLQKECDLLRISALSTCGSTSAFLEVWGIEEDGRGGFIGTRSPSCLQGNPENSGCQSPVESTRERRKVPSVFQSSSRDPSHHVAYLSRDIFNNLLDLGNS